MRTKTWHVKGARPPQLIGASSAFAEAAAASDSAAVTSNTISHGAIHSIEQQRCYNGQTSSKLRTFLDSSKAAQYGRDELHERSSDWLAVDEWVSATETGKENAFSGLDWMLEKIELKEFDFVALLKVNDLETMPDELAATLDDTCDLFAPLAQETNKDPPPGSEPN
ncbi:Cyclic AMP-dependent transcription factor ATF-4 [Fukomys damarensis]|uniref:Cyclic AMP-dependent transcription factor ATF-4 n=1 Tax=Fukomys damarensis TaxID=885580 RepID=A0A091DFW4_FUKDA|nr:Cyclic AMP-dependent transcription factor ATF-4 [Fukomys damarensis]